MQKSKKNGQQKNTKLSFLWCTVAPHPLTIGGNGWKVQKLSWDLISYRDWCQAWGFTTFRYLEALQLMVWKNDFFRGPMRFVRVVWRFVYCIWIVFRWLCTFFASSSLRNLNKCLWKNHDKITLQSDLNCNKGDKHPGWSVKGLWKFLRSCIWNFHWKRTVEKSQTSAIVTASVKDI